VNNIVIVDYGISNVKSVRRGLEYVGSKVTLSSNIQVISNASHLVLPGVGAFGDGIKELKEKGTIEAIYNFVKTGNPLLGICLGMQILFDQSEEYKLNNGIGLIPGSVIPIPRLKNEKIIRKVPNIGWNKLEYPAHRNNWSQTHLRNTNIGDYVYYAHSFMSMPKNNADILAQYDYKDQTIVAAVQKDNVTGLQFHPEKSGKAGLKILETFVNS
jgi:glutamine amidotransferase